MIIEFRHHHGLMLFNRVHPHEVRQIQHRHHMAPQRNDTVHAMRHIGGTGDFSGRAHLLDLEHIDAELFTAAQTEQQDLHLVEAGQIGMPIDLPQQSVIACSQHFFRKTHFILLISWDQGWR
jgi:hypothetical protein